MAHSRMASPPAYTRLCSHAPDRPSPPPSSPSVVRSDNVEDALEKLQEILDDAWQAVQPIEEDPVKKKELEKQLARGNAKRLEAKKFQGDKKKERRAKIDW